MNSGRFSGIWADGELPDPQSTEFESESHQFFSPDELADLLREFADLTVKGLDEIEQIAIAYQSNSFDEENASEIKRRLHSIKGSAANIGAKGIAEICKEAETAFAELEPEKQIIMLRRVKSWICATMDSLVVKVC